MSTLYAIADCARDGRVYDLVHDALFSMCLFRTQVVSPLGRSAPYLVPIERKNLLRSGETTVLGTAGASSSALPNSRRASAGDSGPSTRRSFRTAESSSSAGGTRASSASTCRPAMPTISANGSPASRNMSARPRTGRDSRSTATAMVASHRSEWRHGTGFRPRSPLQRCAATEANPFDAAVNWTMMNFRSNNFRRGARWPTHFPRTSDRAS